jgi:hypothetical protein
MGESETLDLVMHYTPGIPVWVQISGSGKMGMIQQP